ncbi:MAG TPA: Calx-beta domain-containing protein [Baekduia sp.]|nr:Calx-beta domain-containing protein [Baekduia sp.]
MLTATAALCLLATVPVAQARKMSTSYMTSLGPKTATNPIGVNHTVTATVMRHTENCDPDAQSVQIEPEQGATVKFKVVSGPNKGQSGAGTTDLQGHAHFTYTSQKTGTDQLVATPVGLMNKGLCSIDGGPALPSNEVEAIWVPARDGDDEGSSGQSDGGYPQLAINDVRVVEGNDDFSPATPTTFTVSLSKPSSLPIVVEYATADGSAIDSWDYVARHEKLTFAPGELTQTVTIDVRGDHLDEADEWFAVNLSNPLNAQISDAKGIGTIIDDDALVIH